MEHNFHFHSCRAPFLKSQLQELGVNLPHPRNLTYHPSGLFQAHFRGLSNLSGPQDGASVSFLPWTLEVFREIYPHFFIAILLGQLEEVTNKKKKKWDGLGGFKMHPFSEKAAVLKGLVRIHSQLSLLSFGLAWEEQCEISQIKRFPSQNQTLPQLPHHHLWQKGLPLAYLLFQNCYLFLSKGPQSPVKLLKL